MIQPQHTLIMLILHGHRDAICTLCLPYSLESGGSLNPETGRQTVIISKQSQAAPLSLCVTPSDCLSHNLVYSYLCEGCFAIDSTKPDAEFAIE